MKKLIFLVALVTAVFTTSAFAQKNKFYYYPSANVYFDVSGKQYVYYNGGSWTTVKVLPNHIKITQSPRVIVYHTGRNVWVANGEHKQKYKAKVRPGKAKAKGRA